MNINEIKEAIAESLYSGECYDLWGSVLDETSPGYYGMSELEVDISSDDIDVDIQNNQFSFTDTILSVSLRLGASNDADGFDMHTSFQVSGDGEFYLSNGKVHVSELSVNEHLDIYDREPENGSSRTIGAVIGGAILGASLGGPIGTIVGALSGAFLAETTKPEDSKKGDDNG